MTDFNLDKKIKFYSSLIGQNCYFFTAIFRFICDWTELIPIVLPLLDNGHAQDNIKINKSGGFCTVYWYTGCPWNSF